METKNRPTIVERSLTGISRHPMAVTLTFMWLLTAGGVAAVAEALLDGWNMAFIAIVLICAGVDIFLTAFLTGSVVIDWLQERNRTWYIH